MYTLLFTNRCFGVALATRSRVRRVQEGEIIFIALSLLLHPQALTTAITTVVIALSLSLQPQHPPPPSPVVSALCFVAHASTSDLRARRFLLLPRPVPMPTQLLLPFLFLHHLSRANESFLRMPSMGKPHLHSSLATSSLAQASH
jgi:hypothetical protein